MSLSKSPLLAVLTRNRPSRKPLWFMRQAGRYLPEYQAIRKTCTMLDAIQTPRIAAEITLQPLRRFDLDAAIIFADILNPLIGMGMNLDFIEKEGPRIFNPITSHLDVEALTIPRAKDSVGYTLEALSIVSQELNPQGIPVLGFAGAPFTLASYMIEGRGSHSLTKVKGFMLRNPDSWKLLQTKLVTFLSDYLVAQQSAGASALQIFDSWAGYLSPMQYDLFVAPYLKDLVRSLKQKTSVPLMYFSTGTSGLLSNIKELGFDGVSIDWRSKLSQSSKELGSDVPIQGNLDPEILAGPADTLEEEVRAILKDAALVKHHIFNLGHGILPHTPAENIATTISIVRKTL